MFKNIVAILAALIPVGIKLFKDIKNAGTKKEKKDMRIKIKDSRGNYDSIRRALIGDE